jgi:hypothetical protein
MALTRFPDEEKFPLRQIGSHFAFLPVLRRSAEAASQVGTFDRWNGVEPSRLPANNSLHFIYLHRAFG